MAKVIIGVRSFYSGPNYSNLTFAATNLTGEYNRRFVTRTVAEKGLEGEGNVLDGNAPDWRTAWLGYNGRTYRLGLSFKF